MMFKPGQSGNPAGRPKKLLKRVDEVLHERGIEPIAEVLAMIDALKSVRVPKREAPKKMKPAEKRAWQAERRAVAQAAADDKRLRLWLEILPYVYARPKELPDVADDLAALPNQELAKKLLEAVPALEQMAKSA